MNKHYTSNAEWPKEAGVTNIYGKPESSDNHHTEEEARAVCRMLERDGLGGEGEFFPVMTWVEKKCGRTK